MDQETANFLRVKRFFEKLQESLVVQHMIHFQAYEANAEHGTGDQFQTDYELLKQNY